MPDFEPDAYDEAPAAEAIWQDYTPLTPGQEKDVDYLLSFVTDTLARDVLITMKRDGIPPRSQRNEFMSPHAEWGWDATSDAAALEMIDKVEQSEMDEILAHAELTQEDAEHGQPYIPTIGVKVSGTLRVYADEAFDPTVDTPIYTHTNAYTSAPLSVIRYSALNTLRVLVQIGDLRYWIDTTDEDAQFTFVALGEDGDSSTQASEEVVANGNPSDDGILPIIPDEKADEGSLDVEGEIYRWDELEIFVNTDLAELQRRAVENPEIIHDYMVLLEDTFGYDVRFHDDEFYVGEGKNEEKKSAIKQIFNIASSHYHVTNTFGIEIMRTTATATIYYLGADMGADPVIGGHQPEFRGLVPLAAGETRAFIGSEMTIGGITHETFHEIDRRYKGRFSVPIDQQGKGGLEWYLQKKVGRLGSDKLLRFNFGMMVDEEYAFMHLNEDSRASVEEVNQEIFPDVAAAVVFGQHDKDFFSKAFEADEENRIGFARYGPYVKDLICGIHQYFEQIAKGATEPEQFTYDEGACEQFWSEQ